MPYADKDRQREFQRRWVAKRRSDYLAAHPCLHCGGTSNLIVFTGGKFVDKRTDSHTFWSYSAKERELRLKYCVVLCRQHQSLASLYLAKLYKS